MKSVLGAFEAKYAEGGEIYRIDGLSIEYPTCRFNLRGSNTEPVIRLNVETKGDHDLMVAKTQELLSIIRA